MALNEMTLGGRSPRLSIIAAVGEYRELGKRNELIWRIGPDLKRVKELTMGHPIIMGRNTHLSIGKPLPGRTNIVISHLDESFEGCTVVHSLEEALREAQAIEEAEIFIFGGAYVYSTAIGIADRLYLTLIHDTDPDADAFFPEYNDFAHEIAREDHLDHTPPFSWVTLERT